MTIKPLRLRPVFELAIKILNDNNFKLDPKKLENKHRKPVNKALLGKSDHYLNQIGYDVPENRTWHIQDFKRNIQKQQLGEALKSNGFGGIHALLDKKINDVTDADLAVIRLAWNVFYQQVVENNENPEGCYQSLDEFSEPDIEQAFEYAKKIFPNMTSGYFESQESYIDFLEKLENAINRSFDSASIEDVREELPSKTFKTISTPPLNNVTEPKTQILIARPIKEVKKVIIKKPLPYKTATILGSTAFAVVGLAGITVPLALRLLSTHYTAAATTIAAGVLFTVAAILFAFFRTIAAPENKRSNASSQKHGLSANHILVKESKASTPASSPVSANSEDSDTFDESEEDDKPYDTNEFVRVLEEMGDINKEGSEPASLGGSFTSLVK